MKPDLPIEKEGNKSVNYFIGGSNNIVVINIHDSTTTNLNSAPPKKESFLRVFF